MHENWDKGLPHVRIQATPHHLFSFMSLAKKLVVKTLKDLTPYQSARRIGGEGQTYLNANESAFPLKDLSSSFDFGAPEVAEPRPPKFTSISELPLIALVAAVTASFITSG